MKELTRTLLVPSNRGIWSQIKGILRVSWRVDGGSLEMPEEGFHRACMIDFFELASVKLYRRAMQLMIGGEILIPKTPCQS